MSVNNELDSMVIYAELNVIFSALNDMFERKLGNRVNLSESLFTLQRKSKTVGAFSYRRFKNDNDEFRHEISLNPEYFMVKPKIEILRTLCQELLLLYRIEHVESQNNFGAKGIYDAEWADLMITIGLMPSNTGHPDGLRKIGKKISSYILANGEFLQFCNELARSNTLIEWYDTFPAKYEVNDMLLDLYYLKENIGLDRIEPALIEIPLLIQKGINALDLVECLERDDDSKKVEIDPDKLQQLQVINPVLINDEDELNEFNQSLADGNSEYLKNVICKVTGLKPPKGLETKTVNYEYNCLCGNKIKSTDENLDITCNKCQTKYKMKIKKIQLDLTSNS